MALKTNAWILTQLGKDNFEVISFVRVDVFVFICLVLFPKSLNLKVPGV